MSTGFYYNQEVTASMLNDIAIDLGATSFNGYGATKFGTAELNKITQALVTKGTLNSEMGCVPIAESTGYLSIRPGTIVFENGAKLTLNNYVRVGKLTDLKNKKIFAFNDTAAGRAYIKAADSYPAGDYVKLATVNSSGAMTDVRDKATAKVDLKTGNVFIERNFVKEDYQVSTFTHTYLKTEFTPEEWESAKYFMFLTDLTSGGVTKPDWSFGLPMSYMLVSTSAQGDSDKKYDLDYYSFSNSANNGIFWIYKDPKYPSSNYIVRWNVSNRDYMMQHAKIVIG